MNTALQDRRLTVGLTLLAGVAALALAAPLVTGGDPNAPGDIIATRFLGLLSRDVHGTLHLLGTDRFGRDVWTRLVYGARVSLAVGFLSVLLSVAVGVTIGGLSGWWRGWAGMLLLGFTDFALALPRVVLLLLLAALWQPSALLVVLLLAATGWMPVARLVHGEVRALAVRPFVEGARSLGVRPLRVLWRHVLPNALTPVIVAAALGVGNAILLEAGLS
ncbi:MAG: ABC transporter permease, partial [Gemmatimonadota bacterium]